MDKAFLSPQVVTLAEAQQEEKANPYLDNYFHGNEQIDFSVCKGPT